MLKSIQLAGEAIIKSHQGLVFRFQSSFHQGTTIPEKVLWHFLWYWNVVHQQIQEKMQHSAIITHTAGKMLGDSAPEVPLYPLTRQTHKSTTWPVLLSALCCPLGPQKWVKMGLNPPYSQFIAWAAAHSIAHISLSVTLHLAFTQLHLFPHCHLMTISVLAYL